MNTYLMKLKCDNCGLEFDYRFIKGERITSTKVLCPYCDCDDTNVISTPSQNDLIKKQ